MSEKIEDMVVKTQVVRVDGIMGTGFSFIREEPKNGSSYPLEFIVGDREYLPIVRCKDCIHYDEHTRWQCDKFGQSVNVDDYCSYGEPKEREHE